jgi:hypothetical protein
MKTRLTHVSVLQTSKVMAAVYTVFGLIYIPLGFLMDMAAPPEEQLGLFWLVMPILIGVMTFIAVAIGAALYNAIAGMLGGIEFELTSTTEA